jgi:hypothetical protein
VDIAHIPTDNLYKFLALSGLAIIIFAVGFLLRERRALTERMDLLFKQFTETDADVKYLNWFVDAREAEPPKTLEEKDVLQLKLRDLRKRHDLNKVDHEIFRRLDGRLGQLKWGTAIAVLFGMTVATVGFASWYCRVQRFQDIVTRTSSVPEARTQRPSIGSQAIQTH